MPWSTSADIMAAPFTVRLSNLPLGLKTAELQVGSALLCCSSIFAERQACTHVPDTNQAVQPFPAYTASRSSLQRKHLTPACYPWNAPWQVMMRPFRFSRLHLLRDSSGYPKGEALVDFAHRWVAAMCLYMAPASSAGNGR